MHPARLRLFPPVSYTHFIITSSSFRLDFNVRVFFAVVVCVMQRCPFNAYISCCTTNTQPSSANKQQPKKHEEEAAAASKRGRLEIPAVTPVVL